MLSGQTWRGHSTAASPLNDQSGSCMTHRTVDRARPLVINELKLADQSVF